MLNIVLTNPRKKLPDDVKQTSM